MNVTELGPLFTMVTGPERLAMFFRDAPRDNREDGKVRAEVSTVEGVAVGQFHEADPEDTYGSSLTIVTKKRPSDVVTSLMEKFPHQMVNVATPNAEIYYDLDGMAAGENVVFTIGMPQQRAGLPNEADLEGLRRTDYVTGVRLGNEDPAPAIPGVKTRIVLRIATSLPDDLTHDRREQRVRGLAKALAGPSRLFLPVPLRHMDIRTRQLDFLPPVRQAPRG